MGRIVWNGSFADLVKSVEDAAKVYKERGEQIVKEENAEAFANAWKDFGQYQRQIITEIFNRAVNQFYADYKPIPGGYERQYGLRDVLDIAYDYRGTVITGHDNRLLFDENEMHGDRRGGDLFNKVFIEGWHGGAEDSRNGDHPDPGTPYYRTPVGSYRYWGGKAVKTESPYHIINEALEVGEKPNIRAALISIFNKHLRLANNRIAKRVDALKQEIFG